MKKMYIIALVCWLLTVSSCDKENEEVKADLLSLPAQNYTGNEIRTDGYWHGISIFDGVVRFDDCTFFYRNGVIFGGISVYENELEGSEEEYRNGVFYSFAKDYKYCWGRFIVEGNNIKFERWYASEGPLRAYVRAGTILNDTTFKITEYYRMQNGEKTGAAAVNEFFYFKALNPKPDSTNTFTN